MSDFAQWAAKWWIAALFGGVVFLGKWVYKRVKRKADAKKAEDLKWKTSMDESYKEIIALLQLHTSAMISTLYDRLTQAYTFCDERGYCTPQDRRNCTKMFKNYRSLGGNDDMENIMKKLLDLPIKDKKPM